MILTWVRMAKMTGRMRVKTWGTYSSGSIKKICMDWRVLPQVFSFYVYVVRGGKESESGDEASVTEGSDPDSAHPGGYSRRDATSWEVSCGSGN